METCIGLKSAIEMRTAVGVDANQWDAEARHVFAQRRSLLWRPSR